MSKQTYFVPPEHQSKPEKKTTLVRTRRGPLTGQSGAGPHASQPNRERQRGQHEHAEIRRSMEAS